MTGVQTCALPIYDGSFISEYQRYVGKDIIFGTTKTIDGTDLIEYFSEGYREYITNPKNLQEKNSALYEFIHSTLKEMVQ